MYSETTIVGFLGKNPELKFTPKGIAMTKFSVATTNYKDETTWWNVTIFGNQAEACNEYLTKGSPVLVRGEINTDPETGSPRTWEGKDGVTRSSLELTADKVKFLPTGEKKSKKEIKEEIPW